MSKIDPTIRFEPPPVPERRIVVPPHHQPDVYLAQVRAEPVIDEAAERRKRNDEEALQAAIVLFMGAARFAPETTGALSRLFLGVGTRGGRPALSPSLGLYVLPQPFGAVPPTAYELPGNYLRPTTRRLGLPPIESELLHAYEDTPETTEAYRATALRRAPASYELRTFLMSRAALEADLYLFLGAREGFYGRTDTREAAAAMADIAVDALQRREGGAARVREIRAKIQEEIRQRARIPVLRALGSGPVAVAGGARSPVVAQVDDQEGPTTLATYTAGQAPRFMRGLQSGRRDP